MQQYERLVYTICYQFVKDPQLAEDLCQETFLSAYTHRMDCPPDSYKPWLARIAANKAKDYLKSAYRRRVSASEDDALAALARTGGDPPPEELAITRDEAARQGRHPCPEGALPSGRRTVLFGRKRDWRDRGGPEPPVQNRTYANLSRAHAAAGRAERRDCAWSCFMKTDV